MEYTVINWEEIGHVAVVTLNRPEALNAMNRAIRDELMDATFRVKTDDNLRVMVLTGTGRAFCAGADLKERAKGDSDQSSGPASVINSSPSFTTLDIGKPIIAAINGYALGGGLEMSLACDIRIASKNATFGLPEIVRGFFPGGGGPLKLPRLIPRAMAMEMLLTGDPIDADTALQWGLISRVVEPEELLPTAMQLANRIAGHAPLAVKANRELAYATDDMSLSQVQRMSAFSRWIVGQTEDAQEGPRAFVDKREPNYKGQ
ncbi:MAG: enoyl-CoA hydratase [Chloroflexi bacterium]|nr:enoyl-CoA hydratase [Chloroflexota bacterium]|tara:strand:- start:30491 stop:31273 length:783 start_codon:yes stop_codon:yes gene_type:complete